MAARKSKKFAAKHSDPATSREPGDELLSLHGMFRVLGDQMTSRDLKV